MGPIGNDIRDIQLHPSLRCNLRCAHCYSSSSPDSAPALPVEIIEQLLAEAAEEDFNAISVSGGEPLLYQALPRLLQSARTLGYSATVTTNGLPLSARRIDAIAPYVSLIAISLDGAPASHDKMRGLVGAFDRMRARLPLLRDAGVPFGFIFTLTLHNLHELAEVADFAVAEGARLLQVHPLEAAGRARESALDPPDDLELSYGFLEVARLQRQFRDQIIFQYDVADRLLVEQEPCRAFLVETPPPEIAESIPLGHLVPSLVLQEDGWIVPLQHGFSPRYAVNRLGEGTFRDAAARWKQAMLPAFLALARTTWDTVGVTPGHLPFTNWYAAICAASHAAPSPSAALLPTGT
jgi:MoaA/NifB/PqqE/SkfB family radical SAM enzyme